MNWKQRLTLARERRGITKAQLARLAKVSGPTVTDWEGDKTKMIDGSNLVKVAAILQVTPEWIINGSNAMDTDEAIVVQEFAWLYRHAHAEGRQYLRNTIKGARHVAVPPNELAKMPDRMK